ncbi:TMEM175 family protein [Kribbella sp. CA-293567]|uniref:TMEM175 family protein n=1 Tax=Kribbella sp. CA-293567 TaxID=3002436 RepID=UPI0022DD7EC6|nr:TMEM175 family protein [Kribbella sp. CA-293567]WBQ08609.1 TMEM175 family protein [Kribbella sp. CA-293567]
MSRNPDRLVLFTDAVVAIAITLLILPLVEVVTESRGEGLDAQAVISEHLPQIYGFLLSFVVISRFWLTHHRMFEHVKAYNSRLVQLNMVWLLCIVVLPFPTEIVGTYPSTRFTAGLYIGALLALSICQLGLTLLIRNHRELEQESNPVSRDEVIGAYGFTVFSAVALLLAVLVPGIKFYALLVLILTAFDNRIIRWFSTRSAQQAQQ